MGYSLGIAGLPNVGKSTLFNCLTGENKPSSNYPFCTVKPNLGIISVPDANLEKLFEIVGGKELIPNHIKLIDLAGLVEGSHRGEGLGNRFLAQLREVDVVLHLVRYFRAPDIAHIDTSIDPKRDIEIINLELILSDLEIVERRLEKKGKLAKSDNLPSLKREVACLRRIKTDLEKGKKPDLSRFSGEEKKIIADCRLLVAKPYIYALNMGDETLEREKGSAVQQVEGMAREEGAEVFPIHLKIEKELLELPDEQRDAFAREMGIGSSKLFRLVEAGFKLLDLVVFYTVEGGLVQAWSAARGTAASAAAGLIHSDMQKRFVCAEVTKLKDVLNLKSFQKTKENGLTKIEGRDYAVEEADVICFKFGG